MLKVEISCHNQYCIQVKNPTKELRTFLKWAITDNLWQSDFYQKRQIANPFLQSDHEDYILIEFWSDNLDEILLYVDWLNQSIKASEASNVNTR